MKKGDIVYWRRKDGTFGKAKILDTLENKPACEVQYLDYSEYVSGVEYKSNLVPDYLYESPLYRAMLEKLQFREINI